MQKTGPIILAILLILGYPVAAMSPEDKVATGGAAGVVIGALVVRAALSAAASCGSAGCGPMETFLVNTSIPAAPALPFLGAEFVKRNSNNTDGINSIKVGAGALLGALVLVAPFYKSQGRHVGTIIILGGALGAYLGGRIGAKEMRTNVLRFSF